MTMNTAGTVTMMTVPVLFVLLPPPRTPLQRFEFERAYMGTAARVVLYARDAEQARLLADGAFARIGELDARLSDYRDDTELIRLCDSAGGPAVRVSADLLRVLDAANRFAEATDGAFDVTVGPVSRVWRRARAV